ncbi:unnamed protein product [Nesidiocoris tenuis]|uniref:G-protein coupled receptors family 1 profile domain-containing protein n=1 Tax=Nesidiocoris tenuis TaxID=355587 RepID=A0A6H5GLR3_9HEMI|nr:unnamed protein product [Nesidiocoris tenuis]
MNASSYVDVEFVSKLTVGIFPLPLIIGIFGNVLAISIVSCNSSMKTTINLLIASLSLADLLFLVICVPPTGVVYVLKYWPFGDLACRVWMYVSYVAAYASVYTLVLMTLYRYFAVVRPFTFKLLRSRKIWCHGIVAMWIIILMANPHALWMHGQTAGNRPLQKYCNFIDKENHPSFQVQL